jgi:hypothetical protein
VGIMAPNFFLEGLGGHHRAAIASHHHRAILGRPLASASAALTVEGWRGLGL